MWLLVQRQKAEMPAKGFSIVVFGMHPHGHGCCWPAFRCIKALVAAACQVACDPGAAGTGVSETLKPSALATLTTVAKLGLPSADRAL